MSEKKESKIKKYFSLLKENPVSDKMKRIAWISNFIGVAAFILFNIVLWYFVSYKNYLLFDYMPVGTIIVPEVIMLIVVIIPFFIKWGRKRTAISIVISLLMSCMLIVSSVWAVGFNKQIKGFISSFDDTIVKIAENSKISTDDYGVFVLKDDKSKELEDIKDYTFGVPDNYDVDDLYQAVLTIEDQLKTTIKVKRYSDVAKLANAILKKECEAIIADESQMNMIKEAGDTSDDDKNNGPYSDFGKKVKCIRVINVKNQLAPIEDPGNINERCFTVLLSGVDTDGNVTNKSQSDVNVLLSVNPMNNQIVVVSTPSDYYIPLSISGKQKDKLCYAGNYGIDVSMKTLAKLYGTEVDYFVRMNFTGFKDIIDELGGIDIESDYAFETVGYKFKKGLNKNVNGNAALAFSRERKSLDKGDVARGENQMRLIEAVIDKTSSRSILNNYDKILKNISESFQTNMSINTIKTLVKMQLSKADDWKIFTYTVGAQKGVEYTYSIPSLKMHVLKPDYETVKKASKLFENNRFGKEVTEKDTK